MIDPRKIYAILRKDLTDATRQGRIVVILMTPLLLAIFYNFSFRDERRPELKAVYTGADSVALMQRVQARVSTVVDLKLATTADKGEARAAIAERRADIAFVLPDRIEERVRAGEAPPVTVLAESGSTTRELATTALLSTLREVAGQRPPAAVLNEVVDRPGSDPLLITQLGPRIYFVLASLIMVVGMIASIVVPMVLAEESEKRTLDALLLVGSYFDVMIAKALVGVTFIALSTALIIGLTRLPVRDMTTFIVGVGTISVALVGLGLLLGAVFRTAQQVSTWSSLFLIPIMGPAFAVGLPVPAEVELALRALPSSQAMRLIANAFGDRPVFGDAWVAVLVIVAWGALAYGLLGWRLSRREG